MKTNKNMMTFCKMIVFLGYILMFGVVQAEDDEVQLRALLMPDVHPSEKNELLCTAFKIPRSEFIVEFSPIASMYTAHHVTIYGCKNPGLEEPGTPRLVWNCNYQGNDTEPRRWGNYINGPICAGELSIIYAWALGAPRFELPEGVGYRIGEGTSNNYLVLQVHYNNVEKFFQGETDNSGIVISVAPGDSRRVTKSVGIYTFETIHGIIMPHEKENYEIACRIEEQVVMHPFAFFVHTHDLGLMVSGFKIDKDGNWHLVGKRNPQKPEFYYPVEDSNLTIGYGDIIAVRCTMYNFREVSTSLGQTHEDEMCNYFIMYWVDKDYPVEDKICFSDGPQLYSWELDVNIDGVPVEIDLLASEE